MSSASQMPGAPLALPSEMRCPRGSRRRPSFDARYRVLVVSGDEILVFQRAEPCAKGGFAEQSRARLASPNPSASLNVGALLSSSFFDSNSNPVQLVLPEAMGHGTSPHLWPRAIKKRGPKRVSLLRGSKVHHCPPR